ncbi:MAG: sulfite exporter TauE/SafE family protein [Ruminococcaceae bacterium]|nr:sulfite exporter TauE/SafE family protein [Oscillospiraceae bacterium]MBO5005933.1 sulfite exporter TauE/SafE family protein [Clostridia bacterium]
MHLKLRRTKSGMLFLCLCALAAGVVNGIFGTGGGIVIVFALSRFSRKHTEILKKDIFAITLFSCFAMSLSSAVIYALSGKASAEDALPYLLPAAAGGIFGALLMDRIRPAVLSKIFALLVIWGGICFIVR